MGACGFVLPEVSFEAVASLEDEDQSAYKTGLCALRLLFSTILAANSAQVQALHVLIDCKSAKAAVQYSIISSTHYSSTSLGLRDMIAQLLRKGIDVCIHWVPSYGKQAPGWVP